MTRTYGIILCLLIALNCFSQKVSVDISSCSAMMNVIDELKSGQSKDLVSKHLDSILDTKSFVVMFKHYNRPYRPNHLPKGVFKRMILSLRFPEEYTIGEKERADQMLAYWKLFYANPEFYRKSIIQLQRNNLQFLITQGIEYAQSWLPAKMQINDFNFYIIPNGGSGAFAIDSSQGHDFFQLPRDSTTGLIRLDELIGNISHESHHLGINIDYPKNISKQDSLAFKFLSIFIAEGTATKFVDNAPGGVVPVINKKHSINFQKQSFLLWKHYTNIEDSLFKEMFKVFNKIYSGRFNEDSISNAMREYWLSGAIKGPAYFVGAELYGVVYLSFGKAGVFEAMEHPSRLFGLYNQSIVKMKLKKAVIIPQYIALMFERMEQ